MSSALPPALDPPTILGQDEKTTQIINGLTAYKREAETARSTGLNPRDAKWQENMDLYWNRYDTSSKAAWQSKVTMPEVPSYVDRFAAALKEALVASPNGFYTVNDPYDTENNLADGIKNATDVWLSTVGRNQQGTPLDFASVFEEQVKLGAMMATSAVVLWRDDVPGGRVAIETVDPREVWLDHTSRGLYRIRQTTMDKPELARMLNQKTRKGNSIFNLDELGGLVSEVTTLQQGQLSGSGDSVSSNRDPIKFDEYIATLMGPDGSLLMDNELAIIANDKYLVRGPEPIPFKHGKDFLVYAPLVTVPLSPYGRSYMEDFGAIAKIFTELTNLLLDATFMASMNAYAVVPAMLKNPGQMATGFYPNKVFELEEGYTAEEFAKALELGNLDQGAINIWQTLKSELSEAGGMNEIGLGQLPDKSHIAASAVQGAQQSSGVIMRSLAQTLETRWLNPILDLTWKTGLQHMKLSDSGMRDAIGEDTFMMLAKRRNEFIGRNYTFQARGISSLIQRSQELQQLLMVLQVIAQSEPLMQAFMQRVDPQKLIDKLFRLSNVDLKKLEPTAREAMISQVAQQLPQPNAGGQQPSENQVNAMGPLAGALGIGA